MNTKVITAIVGVLVLGVAGVVLVNIFAGPDVGRTEIRTTEQAIDANARTTPEPQGNTFNILTPEERAAADAAARKAAEVRAAAEAASSSASTTVELDAEADIEVN